MATYTTAAAALAAYRENADYRGTSSVTKAAAFIDAGESLLANPTSSIQSATRGESVELDLVRIENALRRARTWLAANQPNGATRGSNGESSYANLNNFRT